MRLTSSLSQVANEALDRPVEQLGALPLHEVTGALLAAVLERCDRERMPAFLEASRARNRDLYERHGFTVTEEFRLGRGAPPQWRMWREPRSG